MPALGMAQETGKLLRWLKAEGEAVVKGEPLMEVETDKVTVEIEAPADGLLGGVSAAEGDDVPVGQAIAFVLADGEPAPEPVAAGALSAPTDNGGSSRVQVSETWTGPAETVARRVLASPKARRLARERGVAIELVAGTGPHGAVQAADVLAFSTPGTASFTVPAAARWASTAPAALPDLETSSAWRTMARRLQASWSEVPQFFLQREVDATRLDSWRAAVRRRPGHEAVTHTDLLVRLCAEALRLHPRVNARWDGDRVVGSGEINVGVAVAIEDALIVPVVHGADRLSLSSLAGRRAELVARARERRLAPDDVAGGTFTISNLGMFGVDAFTAIVNAPQAAILAVGRIRDAIVPVGGAPAVRPILTLTCSFDHRVVDGAAGARFLDTLVSLIEEPAGLVA